MLNNLMRMVPKQFIPKVLNYIGMIVIIQVAYTDQVNGITVKGLIMKIFEDMNVYYFM